MKFWKSLRVLIEATFPEWRDKFLSYKELKKLLKLMYPKDAGDCPPSCKKPRLECEVCVEGELAVSKKAYDFFRRLDFEIEKLNKFVVGTEEDYIIGWKELQVKVAETKDSKEELMKVRREIVDFHGEMVLLGNYSVINCTGLMKILKKYQKRSGTIISLSTIERVLEEPFFKTQGLNTLVKDCELMLNHLFFNKDLSSMDEATSEQEGGNNFKTETESEECLLKVPEELAETERMESMCVKLPLSALRVLLEIRSGSSTVNEFSLPPLKINILEDPLYRVFLGTK